MHERRHPRIAVIQVEIASDERASDRLERVASEAESLVDVDLIVLPELWTVGYFAFDAYADAAEGLDGPTLERLARVAVATGAWLHGGSIVERDGDDLYNTSILLDPSGALVAKYRKVHLFGYRSREREVLRHGREIVVVDTPFGRAGLATCYDLRFPELFRAMVDDGATLFVVPAAWPYPRVEAWTTLNRARALENQAWLISANCVGGAEGQRFCGRSAIVDPFGDVVSGIGDRSDTLFAELDPGLPLAARLDFPQLEDRALPMEPATA
jgi:predicted amidohydrolase